MSAVADSDTYDRLAAFFAKRGEAMPERYLRGTNRRKIKDGDADIYERGHVVKKKLNAEQGRFRYGKWIPAS